MIRVLSFSQDCWSLSELNKLSDKEKLEVAQSRGLSYETASIDSLQEFQQLFNQGKVEEVYIFFVEQVDPQSLKK